MNSSGDPQVVAVSEEIKSIAIRYSEAIDASVKTAISGIALSDDGIGLCDYLIRHSADTLPDVRPFVKDMGETARNAHCQAKAAFDQFNAVKSTIVKVCI
jgi:hypothetical protein